MSFALYVCCPMCLLPYICLLPYMSFALYNVCLYIAKDKSMQDMQQKTCSQTYTKTCTKTCSNTYTKTCTKTQLNKRQKQKNTCTHMHICSSSLQDISMCKQIMLGNPPLVQHNVGHLESTPIVGAQRQLPHVAHIILRLGI